MSVLRRDLPEQSTGQNPTFYPHRIERNETFYRATGGIREERMDLVRKAPKGLKNVG